MRRLIFIYMNLPWAQQFCARKRWISSKNNLEKPLVCPLRSRGTLSQHSGNLQHKAGKNCKKASVEFNQMANLVKISTLKFAIMKSTQKSSRRVANHQKINSTRFLKQLTKFWSIWQIICTRDMEQNRVNCQVERNRCVCLRLAIKLKIAHPSKSGFDWEVEQTKGSFSHLLRPSRFVTIPALSTDSTDKAALLERAVLSQQIRSASQETCGMSVYFICKFALELVQPTYQWWLDGLWWRWGEFRLSVCAWCGTGKICSRLRDRRPWCATRPKAGLDICHLQRGVRLVTSSEFLLRHCCQNPCCLPPVCI